MGDSQQALERCNPFVSASRDMKQAPRPVELSLRIIGSDAENPRIRVGSRLVAVQAYEKVRHAIVKVRESIAQGNHQLPRIRSARRTITAQACDPNDTQHEVRACRCVDPSEGMQPRPSKPARGAPR